MGKALALRGYIGEGITQGFGRKIEMKGLMENKENEGEVKKQADASLLHAQNAWPSFL